MADEYGFDKFERALLDILRNKYPKLIDKELYKIAEQTIGKIKDNTPVNTGLLRNSITRTTAQTSPDGSRSVAVGTNVEYAKHVEYGHRTGSDGFVPGSHMVEKAVQNQQDLLPYELEAWFEKLLKELKL